MLPYLDSPKDSCMVWSKEGKGGDEDVGWEEREWALALALGCWFVQHWWACWLQIVLWDTVEEIGSTTIGSEERTITCSNMVAKKIDVEGENAVGKRDESE